MVSAEWTFGKELYIFAKHFSFMTTVPLHQNRGNNPQSKNCEWCEWMMRVSDTSVSDISVNHMRMKPWLNLGNQRSCRFPPKALLHGSPATLRAATSAEQPGTQRMGTSGAAGERPSSRGVFQDIWDQNEKALDMWAYRYLRLREEHFLEVARGRF